MRYLSAMFLDAFFAKRKALLFANRAAILCGLTLT